MFKNLKPQLNAVEISNAANILFKRRMNGMEGRRLPADCRPQCIDDALAIQNKINDYMRLDYSIDNLHSNHVYAGWKCLLPSIDAETSEQNIYIAPIYSHTIFSNNTSDLKYVKANSNLDGLVSIEPEFAFCFYRNLPYRPQPYSHEEIDAAYTTHMALELILSRYYPKVKEIEGITFPELLADHLMNQGLYIGPEIDKDIVKQASHFNIHAKYQSASIEELGGFTTRTTYKQEHETYAGKHPNVYPHLSVYWLVEFLRQQGLGIEARQSVITGSYAGVLNVPFSTNICIEYENIGQLNIAFNRRKNTNENL
jgi:2-keto-4-pentenoate hydratase